MKGGYKKIYPLTSSATSTVTPTIGYAIDASLELILSVAVDVLVPKDGIFKLDTYADVGTSSTPGFAVDFSDVSIDNDDDDADETAAAAADGNEGDIHSNISTNVINNAITEMTSYHDQIYSFSCVGSYLTSKAVDKLVACIINHHNFRYLAALDLSYTSISINTVKTICRALNPIISGFCPLKRLVLSRCALDLSGCVRVFEAIRGNIFIEEIIITGNKATNDVIPSIISIIGKGLSKIKVLGLGDNDITFDGVMSICEMIKTSSDLRELDLHHNKITDDGAYHIFRTLVENK